METTGDLKTANTIDRESPLVKMNTYNITLKAVDESTYINITLQTEVFVSLKIFRCLIYKNTENQNRAHAICIWTHPSALCANGLNEVHLK